MVMWGYPGLKDTAAKVPVSVLCFNPVLSLKNLDNPLKTTYMLLCAAPDFWVPPGIYSAYSSNIRRFLPGTQSRIGTYFIPHNTVDVQWR